MISILEIAIGKFRISFREVVENALRAEVYDSMRRTIVEWCSEAVELVIVSMFHLL
jgi:hypothetical protein